jgi:chaperonin GroEL
MLVTRDISGGAIGVLSAMANAPQPCKVIAVRAPDNTSEPVAMLDDLAMLTGARPFLSVAGDSLRTVKLDDLGGARRAWADQEFYGIVGGKGAPRQVRPYVAGLRAALDNVEDQEARTKIRQRVARLLGATAVLWIGGISEGDIAARKEQAKRTAEAVRATIGQGFVPGGGVALLGCRPALRRLAEQSEDPDVRVAYQILVRALEEPARTILRNAGYDAAPWLDRIDRTGDGYGLDVRSGEIVDMVAAGIIDSAGVLLEAVREAVSSAGLALTVDVLIHKKKPKTSFEP